MQRRCQKKAARDATKNRFRPRPHLRAANSGLYCRCVGVVMSHGSL
jgi:hypothetical protein